MDERFRGKELWIGLGALGIVFLCVMLCGMGAFLTISLFFTLVAAFFIVPAFLGPPRHPVKGGADAT